MTSLAVSTGQGYKLFSLTGSTSDALECVHARRMEAENSVVQLIRHFNLRRGGCSEFVLYQISGPDCGEVVLVLPGGPGAEGVPEEAQSELYMFKTLKHS